MITLQDRLDGLKAAARSDPYYYRAILSGIDRRMGKRSEVPSMTDHEVLMAARLLYRRMETEHAFG